MPHSDGKEENRRNQTSFNQRTVQEEIKTTALECEGSCDEDRITSPDKQEGEVDILPEIKNGDVQISLPDEHGR